jgi:hypothetical protein
MCHWLRALVLDFWRVGGSLFRLRSRFTQQLNNGEASTGQGEQEEGLQAIEVLEMERERLPLWEGLNSAPTPSSGRVSSIRFPFPDWEDSVTTVPQGRPVDRSTHRWVIASANDR